MKTTKLILFCLLTLFVPDFVYGQYTSYHLVYPECTSSDVLLEVYKAPNSSLLNYKEDDTERQVFLFTKKGLSDSSVYSYKYVPVVTTGLGEVKYTVSDMKIVGNNCYICGKAYVPYFTNDPPGPDFPPVVPDGMRSSIVIKEFGYFAFLKLNMIDGPVTSLRNIYCRFRLVPETKELTKLVVYTSIPESDTIIGLIGKCNSVPTKPCFVSAKVNGSSTDCLVASFNQPEETFTDLALVGKSLVISSRFNDEHYSFSLRLAPHQDVFDNDDFNQLERLITVNTEECPDTWHRNNANIYLLDEYYSDLTTIAYESIGYESGDTNNYYPYFSLFEVKCVTSYPNSYITIYNSYRTSYPAVPYKALRGIKYLSDINKIAFLINEPTHTIYKGLIRLFSWNPSANEPAFFTNLSGISDIDVSSGKCLWTVGTNPSTRAIHQFYDDATDNALCYIPSQGGYTKQCENPDITNTTTECVKNQSSNKKWSFSTNAKATLVTPTVECLDYPY